MTSSDVIPSLPSLPTMPSAAAVGTFDGLHKGHQEVIKTLTDTASATGLRPLVFSFDRHPLALIAPERTPPMLMPAPVRERMLKEWGTIPVTLRFDDSLRNLTAGEWLRTLRDNYEVRTVVLGYDNTFGCDGREMTHERLRSLALPLGIEIVEAPEIKGMSSSAARKAIVSGNIEKASEILGRPYELPGEIVEGERLGRTIGFPTANLRPEPTMAIPARGVYAAKALLPDERMMPAMVNIGVRPTVGVGLHLTIEAHLIGFEGDLYGAQMKLLFRKRLRDEVRFSGLEALKEQLEKDRCMTICEFAPESLPL